jgi:peptidoglycan/LPS O-acetylase OafA/YrhL
MPPLLNFAIAAPIALLFGVASWHLVEKRFIRRDRAEARATVVPAA